MILIGPGASDRGMVAAEGYHEGAGQLPQNGY